MKYKYTKAITTGHRPDGTPIRKYFRAQTKKELNQKVLAYEQEQTKAERVGFSDWAQTWLDVYKDGAVSDATYQMYAECVSRLSDYFHNVDLSTIEQVDCKRFFQRVDDLSSSYVNKLYITLNAIFKTAVSNRYAAFNPLDGLTRPKGQKAKKRPVWTLEQAETAFQFAKAHPYGIGPALIIKTGLRRGELVGVMPSFDIDLTKGLLYVRRSVTDVNGIVKVKESGKSKNALRVIPLDAECVEWMRTCIAFHRDGFLINAGRPDRPRAPRNWARRDFKKFMDDLMAEYPKMPRLTPHELRHTYGTLLSEAGTDINTIKAVMGHSSIEITSKVYVHQSVADLQNKIIFPTVQQ